ncbi:hypothetical protein [Kitasatospora sp. NBC_00315]
MAVLLTHRPSTALTGGAEQQHATAAGRPGDRVRDVVGRPGAGWSPR